MLYKVLRYYNQLQQVILLLSSNFQPPTNNKLKMQLFIKSDKIFILVISLVIVNTLALQCPTGFDLMPPRQPFGICVVIGCAKPIKDQYCQGECIQGFSKSAINSCQVIKCKSTSKTMCTECQSGYQLQALNGNQFLRICVPSNCQIIDKESRKCTKCELGYQLRDNGTCFYANCDQPGSMQCQKCKQAYYLTKVNNSLNVCLPKNCIRYDMQSYKCTQCQLSFINDQKIGICKVGIKYCTNFNQISGLCYSCQNGHRLIAFRSCIKEIPGCLTYNANGCISCKLQFRSIKGDCLPNFCDQYNSTNNKLCLRCEPGYKLNSNGYCEVSNCQNFDNDSWRCFKCINQFYLLSIGSVSNPGIIVQRCLSRFCDKYDQNQVNCTKCNDQYQLIDGHCTYANCQKIGNFVCQKCMDGWRKNVNNNCVIFQCLQYENQKKCKACAPQKRLYKNMCITDNCLVRNKDGSCTQCPAKLVRHEQFTQYCVTPYCKNIDQSSGDCLTCIKNYKLNQKGICVSQTCLNYEDIVGYVNPQCKKCINGFEPKQQICIFSIKFCANYSLQLNSCNKCGFGYQLLPNMTICSPLKCKKLQQRSSYFSCLQCNIGYHKIQFENGTQKCQANNCSKFDDKNGTCLQCKQGYSLLDDICVAWNCQNFNQQGLCTKCQIGFTLNYSSMTCNRIKCLNDSKDGCIKCADQFYPDQSNKGICKPYNCDVIQIIQNDTRCNSCNNGFIKMPNSQKCVALYCQYVDKVTGVCNQCRTGFSLTKTGGCAFVRNYDYCPDKKYPGPIFVCEPIKAKNCVGADSKNTNFCYKCDQNFYWANGKCLGFQNCMQRNQQLGCIKCNAGYKLNITGQCQETVPKCKLYSQITSQCQQCVPGFQLILYPNKICKTIPSYCNDIDPWGNCLSCKDPSRTLNENKLCILKIDKCIQYSTNGFCSKCQYKYYLNNDPLSPSCVQNPQNCQISLNTGQCINCTQNFILSNGKCVNPIKNCVSYNTEKCQRCQIQFYVSLNGLTCNQIPKNCNKIILNTQGLCQECRPGFDNSNGICIRSIQYCISYDNSSGKCIQCKQGYSPTTSQMLCLLGYV